MDGNEAPTNRRIAVLVLERDPLLALSIREALADDRFEIGPECSDIQHVVTASREHRDRIAVFGPSCRDEPIANAIPTLLAAGTRSIVLSSTPLDEEGSLLLLAGASGFLLLEETSPSSLADAVVSVAGGASALHPDVVHSVLEHWRQMRARDQPVARPSTRPELTARELDVLVGLRDGLTNRLLAARLGVAEKTVEAHRSKLYAKFGAKNQAHAVRLGIDLGLL